MKSLELFAGIGGIALAEQMAGIEVAALSEMADFPVRVLQKNFPGIPILPDVKKINSESLRKAGVDPETIELISGGFPCQPFSIAGKRQGTDDDRDLWPEMFRIITDVRPTWVVGENVANFANMELDRTLSNLESIGYEARSFVLPACAVDAPHQRLRTFIVANSDRKRKLQQKGNKQDVGRRISDSSKILDNTNSVRREKSCSVFKQKLSKRKRKGEPCPTSGTSTKWESEPRMGRVADGVPNRMDRITALGNAVVPQQVLPIFQAIMSYELGDDSTDRPE